MKIPDNYTFCAEIPDNYIFCADILFPNNRFHLPKKFLFLDSLFLWLQISNQFGTLNGVSIQLTFLH